MKTVLLRLVLPAAVATATVGLEAEDTYYVQNVVDLSFSDGSLPASPDHFGGRGARERFEAMLPYVVLDGKGEAYLTGVSPRRLAFGSPVGGVLAIRAPVGRDVTGRLFWPKSDASGMVALTFTLPAESGRPDQWRAFLDHKRQHYESLSGRDIPGGAWFRYQARVARGDLGTVPDDPTVRNRRRRTRGRAGSVEDTFALFSGGRAVSENLQLDRILPTSNDGVKTVSVDSIRGITVREFDWKPLVGELRPNADPLARLIPADQHVLLFSSFQAMADAADNAARFGVPLLRLAEPRSEDARTRERYERQLGLSLNAGARWIGPKVVKGVALTGADPYLRTGADVAILLEATNGLALRQLVEAQVRQATSQDPAVQNVTGDVAGVAYRGVRSADRRVCSYIAQLDGAVVVTNSLAQLKRLVDVKQGRAEAVADLDEYAFFRQRYARGDPDESGLLLISDRTIRRWCGPRWRIGASRRTRAVAFMTDIQARYVDSLADESEPEPLYRPDLVDVAGVLTMTRGGVHSSVYGSLQFQTPILELDLEMATQREKELYERWRDGYQRRWSNFFDPIAIRFHTGARRLLVDVTVMPLIAGTEYRQVIDFTQGAKIGAYSGDPHRDSLLHLAMAINTGNPRVQQMSAFARGMAPQIHVDPLSWVGETLAVYADKSPVWDELARSERFQDFLERQWPRVPVALHVEVRSGFKLAAFLTGVRLYTDQSAPGMTIWETRQHRDQPYVRISPSERARVGMPEEFEDVALYYLASGTSFVLTLNEDLLKRAIERDLARNEAREAGKTLERVGPEWLGESLCLQIDPGVIRLLGAAFGEDYQRAMQALSWNNLRILNEWKRRYPAHDPVALHERLWQRRLVCPGGGEYRWNETWQTMESTVYGHPGEPRAGASLPVALQEIQRANFGLTFEDNGLRTRVELER